MRYSTGSYLEDQDFFRISGIERDVYLFARPKTAISDFGITSTLDDTYNNGVFRLLTDVTNRSEKAENVTVNYELLSPEGHSVLVDKKSVSVPANSTVEVAFAKKSVADVLKWNSETPNLYRLLISVTDSKGKYLKPSRSVSGSEESKSSLPVP